MPTEPTLPVSQPDFEPIAVDLARELYDRFVMGGWEPMDAHAEIVLALVRWYVGFSQERDRELQQAREQLAQVVTMESAWKAMGGPKLRAELSEAREELAECKRVSLENLLSDQESYDELREEIARLKEACLSVVQANEIACGEIHGHISGEEYKRRYAAIKELALHPVAEKPKS